MTIYMLDAYCCQGGAGKGYMNAAKKLGVDLTIIGVDIEPQPRYPYTFVQGDVIELMANPFFMANFDCAHASPPCQGYSDTWRIRGREHPLLIEATRDLLQRAEIPYIIENLPGAADQLEDPVMLCGAMFPELRIYRHRLFECNFDVDVPEHPKHVAPQVKMGRPPKNGEWVQAVGNFSGVQIARDAMGIQWMNREGLRECIPPAYAELLGMQMFERVLSMRAAA